MSLYLRKLSEPVELIEFNGMDLTHVNLDDEGNFYIPHRVHGHMIIRTGDYINVTNPEDIYPMTKEYVEKHFELFKS